jgi:hypothetical protein
MALVFVARGIQAQQVPDVALKPDPDHTASASAWSWPRPYVLAESSTWSNGLPVLDPEGDWTRGYQARSGAQRAYQSVRAEAGIGFEVPGVPQAGRWQVGMLARSQSLIDLSGEAAQVLQAYQSRQDPQDPQTFMTQARVLSWRGRGLALHSPTWKFGPASVAVRAEWMQLKRLRISHAQGSVTYQGEGAYDYQLQVDDSSPSAHTYFLPKGDKLGQAQSLSLALGWQASDTVDLSVRVDDLWSRLHWAHLNALQANIDTQVASKTAEGYVEYQAAIQGQYTPGPLEVRIPRAVEAVAQWRRPEGQWALRLHHLGGLTQSWLGWHTPSSDGFGLAIEPRYRAMQWVANWRGLQAQVMFDRLDSEAHVRQWGVGYAAPW